MEIIAYIALALLCALVIAILVGLYVRLFVIPYAHPPSEIHLRARIDKLRKRGGL